MTEIVNPKEKEKLKVSQEMQMRLRRMVQDGVRIKIIAHYTKIPEEFIKHFIKTSSHF